VGRWSGDRRAGGSLAARRRLRAAAGLSAALVVLAAVALAAKGLGGAEPDRSAAANAVPGAAQVTRATLTQTERVSGTLGYGPATTVRARTGIGTGAGTGGAGSADGTGAGNSSGASTSSGAGAQPALSPSPPPPPTTNTITWLPAPGAVIRPGEPAYKVDNRPVVAIAGGLPPYRLLAPGVNGPDVAMLERNVKTFGYGGFTVDQDFTAATASAVKRWQKRLGLPQTGTIDVNQVVVAPAAMRVSELKTAVGADASGEVLAYTGTTRVVTVALEVTRQHLVHKGMIASVALPDGKTVAGKVASIGTVASGGPGGGEDNQAGGASQGGGQPAGPATVQVTVTIADQAALGTLDTAPVDLVLTVAERKDVLTVPVAALVALAEGGYGVQVVQGTVSRYVAVKTGMFADGQVEVSGDGITEGVTVGVPA
jgi:peptidoglycan hydrolase-like protein with peptidoglycan-binding domain